MISKPHNCIFIHIPKTGGQSIEQCFLNLLGLSWEQRCELLLRANDDPTKGPERLAHLTAEEYLACGHVSPHEFDRFFKFAFVRNPWDRLVSEFEYRKHEYRSDFKTFLFKRFPKTPGTDEYRHIVPQHRFVFAPDGTCMVDFIGRFERLCADFMRICRTLNLPGFSLPHRNKTHRRREYESYYDTAAMEFVRQYYARDIELFGYTFGGSQQ